MAQSLFFVGSFTCGEPYFTGARGEGISSFALDNQTGCIERRHVYRDILNPDYLCFDPVRRMLFATVDHLQAPSAVAAFAVIGDGQLRFLNQQSSLAPVSCHVAVAAGGNEVYTACYMNSCLTAHAVTDTGVGELQREFRYVGGGPNAARQEASHAHHAAISPDGRWLYVCDLGADRVWIHRIHEGHLAPDAPAAAAMPPGYGPRHLIFHRALPTAYVICELTAHVLVCHWQPDSGALVVRAEIATAPPGADPQRGGAAIRLHPHADTLYVGDRADDSIAVLHLPATGLPSLIYRFNAGGRSPRDFNIDPSGRWLVVACQDSDALTVHELNTTTGLPLGRQSAGARAYTPTCVVFA